MEIEESRLLNEIQLITGQGPQPISFYWSGEVHTGDITTQFMKVTTINIFRDYEKNIGDEILLEVAMPLGVLSKIVYPNRNVLEVTLYRLPIVETGSNTLENISIDSERYKAVLVMKDLPVAEGTEKGQLSQDSLDLLDVVKVTFQLFNRSLEKLRLVTVGGIFRKATAEKVIRGILANQSSSIKINGKPAIDAVDIIKASNQETREHFIIPQGTRLIRLPTYIHERCGGVYNSGIGTYLQDKTWYVYPLYDTTKINQEEKTLTFIKVPTGKFTGIERTYREENGSVFILGTSQSSFSDDGSTNFMNEGNGVRIADAKQFMGNVAKTKDNRAIVSRSSLNYEFISREKDDGLNIAFTSRESISANPFLEYSKLAARDGGIYQFVWENAKPSLLFPGMRVRVLYTDGNNLTELNGVLLATETLTQLSGDGITNKRHITTTHISIFVNKVRSEA